MFIVNSYGLAVVFCLITMLCWGSWANTQKLAAKSWRYELFYWDYVIGMVLFSLVLAFTAGSIGTEGRPFLQDIGQASWGSIGWVLLGGLVFNVSNILLSASTSIAGMAVAFPLGVGIALVMGVLNNLLGRAEYRSALAGSRPGSGCSGLQRYRIRQGLQRTEGSQTESQGHHPGGSRRRYHVVLLRPGL